jgi:hypothetical protein
MSVVISSTPVDRSRRTEVVGACIISAAGSLPLHLMSFMVALAAIDGLLPVERAGWINSFFFAGLLAATVALPLLGFKRVTPLWPIVGIFAVIVSLWVGTVRGTTLLLGGWVMVGAVCGALHFLGSTSAASYQDRHFVFGLRLALVLFAAAIVIGGAGLVGGFRSYGDAALVLGIGFTSACFVGLLWYRPPPVPDQAQPTTSGLVAAAVEDHRRWHGLGITALFFAGQPGFAAYAAHLALSHGIEAAGLPAVYAGCKAAGAVVLLKWGSSARSGVPTLRVGAALAVAVLSMALARDLVVFAVGLLIWEIAVNVQSTRLQATVVAHHPSHSGPWLPAAIAVGAGGGPAIFGALLGHGMGHWFVAYSVLSGLLPAAWVLHRARAGLAPGSSS